MCTWPASPCLLPQTRSREPSSAASMLLRHPAIIVPSGAGRPSRLSSPPLGYLEAFLLAPSQPSFVRHVRIATMRPSLAKLACMILYSYQYYRNPLSIDGINPPPTQRPSSFFPLLGTSDTGQGVVLRLVLSPDSISTLPTSPVRLHYLKIVQGS